VAKRDPSRTINIHGDRYTYDSNKNKWMSGKKEATPATAAMLDMVLKELDPSDDEEVESFVGTANIVPDGTQQQEDPENEAAKEEARERKEEAQDVVEESPPNTEAEKQQVEEAVAEPIKPEPVAGVVAPPAEPTEKPVAAEPTALPQPDVVGGEVRVREIPAGQQPKTRATKIKEEFNQNFSKRVQEQLPFSKVVANQERKPEVGVFQDMRDNLKEMWSDRENWFKKREPIEQRESLNKLSDLSPEEIKRLEERGVAPASENDFSYRKEGKPLSKEQILEELNTDANERNEKPDPFYKRRAEQLKGEFKENFKARLNEKLPGLRLFTDKLDPKKDEDDAQKIEGAESSGAFGGFSSEAVDSLKSIDAGIQELVSLFKERDSDEDKEEQEEDQKEENAENDQQDAALDKSVDELEAELVGDKRAKTGAQGESEGTEKVGFGNIGKTLKNKISEKFGFGSEATENASSDAKPEGGGGLGAAVGGAAKAGIGKLLGKLPIPGPIGAALKVASSFFADGGVVNNAQPIKMFADGGVVNEPTAFSHDGGTGIMGEAGPEAIMPLARGLDGKLGVKGANLEKPAITDQTKILSETENMRKDAQANPANQAGGTAIINNVTNNNTQGGGGGGGAMLPTAGARNSLDLHYYAQ